MNKSNIGKLLSLGTSLSLIGYVYNDFSKNFKRPKPFIKEFDKDNIYQIEEKEYSSWFNNSSKKDFSFKTYDGLNINAYLIENNITNNYIIFSHGLYGSFKSSFKLASEFDLLGYNSIIYDQRAHGESEGTYCTYGLKESLDLIKLINKLVEYKKDVNIILCGHSMGAATVMMALGSKLPINVKCAIEDSGYDSLGELFKQGIKKRIKYTFDIIYYIYNSILNLELGMSFKDVEPKRALLNNTIPLLIIHGKDDEIVPYEMSKHLYNYNVGTKYYYQIENCGHCMSYRVDKDYFKKVDKFIKEQLR